MADITAWCDQASQKAHAGTEIGAIPDVAAQFRNAGLDRLTVTALLLTVLGWSLIWASAFWGSVYCSAAAAVIFLTGVGLIPFRVSARQKGGLKEAS